MFVAHKMKLKIVDGQSKLGK